MSSRPQIQFALQILLKEFLKLVERNDVPVLSAVIEVGVRSAGYHQKLLVICIFVSIDHVLIGILTEVEGVCLIAVHYHYC